MFRRVLEIVFAAENLLPPIGGAELAALEWLGFLAGRHSVRAVWVGDGGPFPAERDGVELLPVTAPAAQGGYWKLKRLRREAVGRRLDAVLGERPADVVVTALHAAPAVVAAACRRGAATVLMLHSYESLCKYAFDPASGCRPDSRCRRCPRARALEPSERRELFAARDAHERSLLEADRLVAPSQFAARACEAWCGRRPAVAPSVMAVSPPLPASPAGHVLLASARWQPHKGVALLEPLARELAPRPVVITAEGLDPALSRRLATLSHVEVRPNGPIAELLTGARALLVPSQMPESFGRLAFEGLASGVPTLASAVGGLPEYVPAGQLVGDTGSVSAWARALEALEEPSRWEAARQAGIEAAREVVREPPMDRLEAVLLEARARAVSTGAAHGRA